HPRRLRSPWSPPEHPARRAESGASQFLFLPRPAARGAVQCANLQDGWRAVLHTSPPRISTLASQTATPFSSAILRPPFSSPLSSLSFLFSRSFDRPFLLPPPDREQNPAPADRLCCLQSPDRQCTPDGLLPPVCERIPTLLRPVRRLPAASQSACAPAAAHSGRSHPDRLTA